MSSIKQLEQTILNGMARDKVADLQLESMIPTFINELYYIYNNNSYDTRKKDSYFNHISSVIIMIINFW